MAKITITIEDKPGDAGLVMVAADPSFAELMKRITSGDAPSAADRVAAVALRNLARISKLGHQLDLSNMKELIKPN